MSTSGTYTFSPSLGDAILDAFEWIGIRRPSITQDHLQSASRHANYMQAEWSNKGVTLWTVDLVSLPLVQGTATYSVDPSTVMVLDLYVNNGSQNRLIVPFSRSDYASLSNPSQQGFPTSFWFDRLTSPTLTFWPVPDGNATYTVSYYRYRQMQDATAANAANAQIPYLFLDAFVKGLAARMAVIYAPDKAVATKALADEAWNIASTQYTENVPMYITPGLSGYYRI